MQPEFCNVAPDFSLLILSAALAWDAYDKKLSDSAHLPQCSNLAMVRIVRHDGWEDCRDVDDGGCNLQVADRFRSRGGVIEPACLTPSSHPRLSTMHHAFSIPEVVERIIQLAERREISACMYVCKLWSEFALDNQWETINWDCFMDNLFTILFPELRERIDDVRSRSKLPDELSDDSYWKTQGDWNRFRYYANRIKYLPWDSNNITDWEVDYKIMAILARTCPHQHIFPRLYDFTVQMEPDINGSITYIAKYFCESLRVLGLNLPELSPPRSDSSIPSICGRLNVPTFVQDLVRCSPNIADLKVSDVGRFGMDEMESGVMFLLSGLQRLTTVHISSEVLSPRVLIPLALLPHLKDLHVIFGSGRKTYKPIENPFPPELTGDTFFPALTDLYIRSSVDTTNTLLRSLSGSEKLRVLTLQPTRQSTEQQREVLSSTISTCSNLVGLSIYDVAFSASTLSPLRRLKELESLALQYSDVSTLIDVELLDLVKSLPRLTFLQLSPSHFAPIHQSSPAERSTLTLNSLALLSHQPNRLRSLHLQVRGGPDVDFNVNVGVHLKGLTDLVIDPIGVSDPLSFITDVNNFMNRCLSEECVRAMATLS